MKITLSVFLLVALTLSLALYANFAVAQNTVCSGCLAPTVRCGDPTCDIRCNACWQFQSPVQITAPGKFILLQQALEATAAFIAILVIPISAIVLIWAGITLLTSAGNQNKVAQGKKILLYGIVGAAVGISAYAIVLTLRRIAEQKTFF